MIITCIASVALLAAATDTAAPIVQELTAAPIVQELAATETDRSTAEVIAINRDRVNRMTVPVSIDGKGPFSFLIDTGSERTVVSRTIAGELGLEFAEMARLVSIAGSRVVETVYVPELTLGRQNYGEVIAPLLETHHMGADGILGLDGLQNQRILFDFRENKISIEDINKRNLSGSFEIVVTARRKSGQLIFTDAVLNGRRINVVIDTGAQNNIGNLALQRRLNGGRMRGDTQTSLMSVTGQTIMADIAYANDFQIGRAHFDYIPIAFADAAPFRELGLEDKPALLLGMSTLRLFNRMAIDFKNRRVLFDLPDNPQRFTGRVRL